MPLPRTLPRVFSPRTTLAASTMGVNGPSLAGPMVASVVRCAVTARSGACTTNAFDAIIISIMQRKRSIFTRGRGPTRCARGVAGRPPRPIERAGEKGGGGKG